jgi:hypothetical protein
MRVLFFWDGHRRTAIRNQIGFMTRLNKYCEFYIYGPKEHNINEELAPLIYDGSLTALDLEKEFKPDVFLVYMHERFRRCRIKGFEKVTTPKIMMESNYWLVEKDWYRELGIDLLIFRTPTPPKDVGIPSLWLPFSANEEEFFPLDNTEEKKNLIVYVGSTKKGEIYSIRVKARELLRKEKLIDDVGFRLGESYAETLHEYTCGLACSLKEIRTPVSKIFEMMACGTVVLTSPFDRSSELFGDKQCYFEYKSDCSDVVDVAKEVLSNESLRQEVISNAYDIVSTKHMHKHRVKELYDIISGFLVEGRAYDRIET